eukprot:TRINITY_DN76593_c0_g1_i1.p1 TRINITY_DN76593_c0_g1~~TRINITY_DN76593_c0_g1_i1.p1  ORF type:complete len:201 (-),score=38.49 TRINITY_DN76593_c0_g1_i1:226-828(-)
MLRRSLCHPCLLRRGSATRGLSFPTTSSGSSSPTPTPAPAVPAASAPASAPAPASKPAEASKAEASQAEASKPAEASKTESGASEGSDKRRFEGVSATDEFADIAHAGFEVGSAGRFGYSRKASASLERIFGKKKQESGLAATAHAVAPESTSATSPKGESSRFSAAIAADSVLPWDLKRSLNKLSEAQLDALTKLLKER